MSNCLGCEMKWYSLRKGPSFQKMCNAEERAPWWVCVQGNWAGWLTAQGSSVCVTPSCSCRVPGWPGEHFLFLTPLTVAGGRGGSGGRGTAGQTPHQPKGAASVHHQNLKLLSSSPRKQVNYWGPPRDSWPAPQIAVGYSFFSLELLPMDHTVIKGFHWAREREKTVVREEWLAERRRDKSHVADNREQSQTKSWDMCFGGKKKKKQGMQSFPCFITVSSIYP